MSYGALLRFLGSLSIIFTGTLLGHGMAKNLEKDEEEAKGLERGLMRLSSEISYSLSPLPFALMAAGEAAGGAIGDILSRMGGLSGLKERRIPKEAYLEALSGCEEMPPKEVIKILSELSLNLGFLGHKEQLLHVEAALERTRDYLLSQKEEVKKKARLFRYLGALCAVCVVLVLI